MQDLNSLRIRRLFSVCMTAAVLGSGPPAIAAEDPPDFTITFPKGVACADFDLYVEGWNGKQHIKEFKDKKGFVRTLSAGTGSALRFTNTTSGAKLSLRSNGAVSHITYNPDGSYTQKLTGHNILILFPTDVPAGPSTTLYVGSVVFTVDINLVTTVVKESGNKTDICAALR